MCLGVTSITCPVCGEPLDIPMHTPSRAILTAIERIVQADHDVGTAVISLDSEYLTLHWATHGEDWRTRTTQ